MTTAARKVAKLRTVRGLRREDVMRRRGDGELARRVRALEARHEVLEAELRRARDGIGVRVRDLDARCGALASSLAQARDVVSEHVGLLAELAGIVRAHLHSSDHADPVGGVGTT